MATVVEIHNEEIAAALRHLSAGSIDVVDVDVEPRDEPDRSYLLVQLRLSRPTGEQWDVDDFYGIRRQARTAVTEIVQPGVEFELSYVTDDASEVADSESAATDDLLDPSAPSHDEP